MIRFFALSALLHALILVNYVTDNEDVVLYEPSGNALEITFSAGDKPGLAYLPLDECE